VATLSHSELETVWVLYGGLVSAQDTAAAIAQAESGGRTDAIANTAYPNRPGYHAPPPGALKEYSVGLWQINMLAHPQYTEASLLTAAGNAKAAVAISRAGASFSAWSTYDNNAPTAPYRKFLTGTVSTTPQPGTTFAAPSGAVAPRTHSGYADLRNSIGRHLPTQLRQSKRTGEATLRLLTHRHKVKH
jgi:hypothetical protein